MGEGRAGDGRGYPPPHIWTSKACLKATISQTKPLTMQRIHQVMQQILAGDIDLLNSLCSDQSKNTSKSCDLPPTYSCMCLDYFSDTWHQRIPSLDKCKKCSLRTYIRHTIRLCNPLCSISKIWFSGCRLYGNINEACRIWYFHATVNPRFIFSILNTIRVTWTFSWTDRNLKQNKNHQNKSLSLLKRDVINFSNERTRLYGTPLHTVFLWNPLNHLDKSVWGSRNTCMYA